MATGYKSQKCWNIWNGAQFLTPTCRCHCHLTWPNWRILWAMGVDWLLDIMDHHCGRCTKHLAPMLYQVSSTEHLETSASSFDLRRLWLRQNVKWQKSSVQWFHFDFDEWTLILSYIYYAHICVGLKDEAAQLVGNSLTPSNQSQKLKKKYSSLTTSDIGSVAITSCICIKGNTWCD